MKKIISLLLVFAMLLVLASCMPAGDMKAPTDLTFDETAGDETDEVEVETVEQTDTMEPIEEPNGRKVIKFAAVGDALIHSAIYREAEQIASQMPGYPGNYYFSAMYEHVSREIKNADIAFVNHEAPIANTTISGYPTFNAPSESGDALVGLGFNVVNIANNHMFDADGRTTGYADTINYWATKDVLQIGGYKDETDYDTVRVLTVDDVKIAFLGYTFGVNSGTNMNYASSSMGYIKPFINDNTLIRHIAAAKEQADLVFVSMHWGTENVFEPTAEQKRLAQLIADNGADVIIGHHSHTIQPVEWVTGKDGNKTLCVYSLGNFISGMLTTKNMVGGLMTFDIVKENDQITIENPIFKPTMCHYKIDNFSAKDPEGNPVRTGFKVYLLEEYNDGLVAAHGTQNYGKFTLSTLHDYVKNTISAEFLPDYLK